MAAALASRLRRFREAARERDADLVFRYVTDAAARRRSAPAGAGRPVYDTPLGDVRYSTPRTTC